MEIMYTYTATYETGRKLVDVATFARCFHFFLHINTKLCPAFGTMPTMIRKLISTEYVNMRRHLCIRIHSYIQAYLYMYVYLVTQQTSFV